MVCGGLWGSIHPNLLLIALNAGFGRALCKIRVGLKKVGLAQHLMCKIPRLCCGVCFGDVPVDDISVLPAVGLAGRRMLAWVVRQRGVSNCP